MCKDIDEALDKIYSYMDYSLTHAENVPAGAFSLDKMRCLLKKLHDPQDAFRVVHIAGTKGKGSVCAMLSAAFQSAGLKVGLYSSPHLIRFNERIQVNGRMISDEEIIALTNEIDEYVDPGSPVSSFEFMTAMAFLFFKRQKVDVAVIEVGLGGRLDSTNVVKPVLTGITTLSLDHTAFLGDTIEEIAAEKGGIIKSGIPVVVSAQLPAASAVLKNIAEKQNSPWIGLSERYRWFSRKRTDHGQEVVLWRVEDQKLMEAWTENESASYWKPAILSVPLAGDYQAVNAVMAYSLLTKYKAMDPSISLEKMRDGIAKTFWPCRFEKIQDVSAVYIDGAHNPDSICKLGSLLDRCCGTKKIICVFGVSADKSVDEMLSALVPHVDEFITIQTAHPRAMEAEKLSSLIRCYGLPVRTVGSPEAAAELMRKQNDPEVCFIVTGSLFAAAAIRELWMQKDKTISYFN